MLEYLVVILLLGSTDGWKVRSEAPARSNGTYVRNGSQNIGPRCLVPVPPAAHRDDYKYTPGIGAHKLHEKAENWNNARHTCENEGGHLSIINSKDEAHAVSQIFKKFKHAKGVHDPDMAYLGFHDLYNEGEFVTIHGQSIAKAGFERWAKDEPNNQGGDQNCGAIHKVGLLHDVHCDAPLAFFCELPL